MPNLRNVLATVFLAMSGTVTAACSSEPSGPDGRVVVEAGEVAGTGTIRHSTSFGGFWYLEAKGGEIYLPMALSDEFRREHLAVTFVGRLRPDIPTSAMVGSVIELTSLVPR